MEQQQQQQQQYPYYIVDAFTRDRFHGNPAAVVLLPQSAELNDQLLQDVAAEFNLSETAFVWCESRDLREAISLRWFTPSCEVDLCGHATLAAATAVARHRPADCPQTLVFSTLSGQLVVSRDAGTGEWSLDLPVGSVSTIEVGEFDASERLLSATLGDCADGVRGLSFSADRRKLLVELLPDRRRQFLSLRPDFGAMLAAAPSGRHIRGVIVTMPDAEGEYDFLSRYFAPWVGIPEDPVTGAAHTVLAPHWSRRFGGRSQLHARQCSARAGCLRLRLEAASGRVLLSGHSVVSASGQLYV